MGLAEATLAERGADAVRGRERCQNVQGVEAACARAPRA